MVESRQSRETVDSQTNTGEHTMTTIKIPANLANSYRLMTADDLSNIHADDRIVWLTATDKGRYGRVLSINGKSIRFKTKTVCVVGSREWDKVVTWTAKPDSEGHIIIDRSPQPLLVKV